MNASWVQTLFATKSLDSKSSSIYSSSEYYNISLSQKRYCNMICNCFWFFVKYLGLHLSLLNLFLFFPFFPCLHSPPPASIDHHFYCHFQCMSHEVLQSISPKTLSLCLQCSYRKMMLLKASDFWIIWESFLWLPDL